MLYSSQSLTSQDNSLGLFHFKTNLHFFQVYIFEPSELVCAVKDCDPCEALL